MTSLGTGRVNDGVLALSLPSTVTLMDGSAFINCAGLTTITIPENVETIEPRASPDAPP